jgi:hypothetical protein
MVNFLTLATLATAGMAAAAPTMEKRALPGQADIDDVILK